MIKKTLTVTLQEKDPVTKEEHDILMVKRGHKDTHITIEPCILGKVLVEKVDLANAVAEIEAFYSGKPAPTHAVNEKFDEPTTVTIETSLQVPKELKEAMKDTYFAVEHGE